MAKKKRHVSQQNAATVGHSRRHSAAWWVSGIIRIFGRRTPTLLKDLTTKSNAIAAVVAVAAAAVVVVVF